MLEVGDIVTVENYKGDGRTRTVKIEHVRDIKLDTLTTSAKIDRSRYLITTIDEQGEYRSFYHKYAKIRRLNAKGSIITFLTRLLRFTQ